MTRYANMADLQRNISPDVRIVDQRDQLPPNAHVANAHVAAILQGAAETVVVAAGVLLAVGTPAPTEHDEQAALFAWAAANEAQHPELCCMFAIPNGGHRHPAVAAMLKAEGVRAGVPDCLLAVRRGRWGGLFLELKRADHSNHATPAQQEWIERLRAYGYSAIVAYGCEEAKQAIMAYLAQEGVA